MSENKPLDADDLLSYQFFETDSVLYPGYDPEPTTVLAALHTRVVQPEWKMIVADDPEDAKHHYEEATNQDSSSLDPFVFIADWYSAHPDPLEEIRKIADPQPTNVDGLLRFREDQFISAVATRLKDIPFFPLPQTVLGSFMVQDISYTQSGDEITLRPSDSEDFLGGIIGRHSFMVKFFLNGSRHWYQEVRMSGEELLARLLWNFLKMNITHDVPDLRPNIYDAIKDGL